MAFESFADKLRRHFMRMTSEADMLYAVAVDADEMWNLYLDSFSPSDNMIFRKRREYDCSCCRHFIKAVGNVVTIKNGKVTTIWEFNAKDEKYQPVIDALDRYVKEHPVKDVFLSTSKKIGAETTLEMLETGRMRSWHHFSVPLPAYAQYSGGGASMSSEIAMRRDTRNVFKRSLDEISVEATETVLELISSNTLYRGQEWKVSLLQFRKLQKEYNQLDGEEAKELYAWEQSVKGGIGLGRIRNHSIGVLLTDISNDIELNEAVRRYESIVAPANYKRPKAIFTKKMIEDAKATITELGYLDSLERRFATLDDISINNILFSNKDSAKRIVGADGIFADLERQATGKPKKFSKVEEISIDKFVADVLPDTREIELYLENRHIPNMVSLIAPINADSKTMFKWNNNFSWAYSGNVTDSMKERVKAAGGKVDGDLRFSIQWNEDGTDNCDLDAHCIEAHGYEIYYGSAKKPRYSPTKGQLDVDIIHPNGNVAVENITWADRKTMDPGVYKFFVHQFSGSAKNGFRAEIEFDGQVYSFDHCRPMRTGQKISVAEVTLGKDGTFSIRKMLPSNMLSREVWGVSTNQFVPVSVVMNSPNYWDEQNGIGHKHFFFMLKGCVNPEMPNGFFNEYLKPELERHKRVFEALGSQMHVADVDDQLSGVGFSETKRNDVVLNIKGSTERIIRVKF